MKRFFNSNQLKGSKLLESIRGVLFTTIAIAVYIGLGACLVLLMNRCGLDLVEIEGGL